VIPLPSGETLVVGARLGAGAFGIVHEAVDDFENRVVIKTLTPSGGTYQQVKERWEREFSALSLFRHPHITHVYNWVEHNAAFSIVIERCDGTLADLMGMVPNFDGTAWIRAIARCLLSGIHFIHSQGYVHKDIHLGNVFYMFHRNEMAAPANSMTFKIGDLGISNLETNIDTFFGTLLAQWMLPPEYLRPDLYGVVGQTTDLYHAALLLLSVYHGRALHFTQAEILDGLPRQMAEQLPEPWATALGKALRRTVAQRTQTALEFWHDIR
jgi:serine/threonine-protein kinase